MIAKRIPILLAALGGAGGLTAVHVHVSRQGLEYSGPLLFFEHLFVLAAVLVLIAICTAVGLFWLRRIKVELDLLDDLVFAVALGVGVLSLATLILGLLGGLHPGAVLLLPVSLGLVAHRELRDLPRLSVQAVRQLQQKNGDRVLWGFGIAVFAAAVVFMSLYALAPPMDWDALMYHLRVPQQFLEHRRIYLPTDNLHVSRVGLVHMLYLPLLALSSSAGPATLAAVLAALLGIAVFAFCVRLLGEKTASLSLGLMWGTTTILLVAISPRVDVSLTLYLFLAHYALLLALSQPEWRKLFFLAAALLGFAVGVKLTALPYIAGLSPLVAWIAYHRTRTVANSLQSLFLFGLCFLAAGLPWLIKNWALLGAPFYPFLADPVLQPWLRPLFGSAAWPASVDPDVLSFIWELRAPFNLRDAFFTPGQLAIEAEGGYYYPCPALLLLPLWLMFVRNKTLSWLVFPVLIFLLIVLVIQPTPNLRYLIPAAVPLTIVVAHVLVATSERLFSKQAARILLVGLTGMALVPSAIMVRDWLTKIRGVEHFVGTASAEDYLSNWLGPGNLEVLRLTETQLAADSRILMLFDARGYYFERTVLQDNKGTNWPLISSVIDEDECLESVGVSHVLLGLGPLSHYFRGGLDPEHVRWSAFQQFAGRCLEPILEDLTVVLLRVRSRSSEPSDSLPAPLEAR
ncbi:MAG: hypothetical protein JSW46_13705 [Gemmatimonadota bacterium]|nr:MAG: hypothetical protein JSW46_13705 [Gemmatimonadota bacterium]